MLSEDYFSFNGISGPVKFQFRKCGDDNVSRHAR